MKNLIAFIVAAVLCASIVLIASVLFFPEEESSEDMSTVPLDLTVSQSDCREALFGFRFSLDGEDYALPCGYGDFEKNGWILRNPTESIEGFSNLTGVYLKKSDACLKTEIINYNNESIMCCKGQIHSVSASVADFNEIDIRGAITCDKSTTPTMITQKLGQPDAVDENDVMISLIYNKTEYQKVTFVFYKKRLSDYGGHPQTETGYRGEQLYSGYYGHVVIIECRTDL